MSPNGIFEKKRFFPLTHVQGLLPRQRAGGQHQARDARVPRRGSQLLHRVKHHNPLYNPP